jgi:hypothetical protein
VTTRAEPLALDEGLLARAAEEAIARAQEMSMMLTGEPLVPRLELGLGALVARPVARGRARLAESIAPPPRAGFATWWGGRPRAGGTASAEPRYPLKGLLVPLLVFAGLLATVLVTHGDGTRGVLALGVVAVAVLIILIPVLARRQGPASLPRAEIKEVIDVMAGVILASYPAREEPVVDAPTQEAPAGT